MFLNDIFHWFYCLPISSVFALAILFTLLFLALHSRLSHYRWWRIALVLFLVAADLGILWQTLLCRTPGLQKPPVLVPFGSYITVCHGENPEILRSNLMNVLLFYPSGFFSALLIRSWNRPVRRVLLIVLPFFIISAGVEFLQYYLCLGIFELDDIIHNTLGVLLGAIAVLLPSLT